MVVAAGNLGRCNVHFLRNALAHAGKGQPQVVLAMINTVFAQESFEAAIAQWRTVADQTRRRRQAASLGMAIHDWRNCFPDSRQR